jgi:hypothetical protein
MPIATTMESFEMCPPGCAVCTTARRHCTHLALTITMFDTLAPLETANTMSLGVNLLLINSARLWIKQPLYSGINREIVPYESALL